MVGLSLLDGLLRLMPGEAAQADNVSARKTSTLNFLSNPIFIPPGAGYITTGCHCDRVEYNGLLNFDLRLRLEAMNECSFRQPALFVCLLLNAHCILLTDS